MSEAYKRRSDEDIAEIALAMSRNGIFASWYFDAHEAEHMMRSVFMTLNFLRDEDIKWMADNKIAHVFEYMSKAGQMSVNGYPTFFSHCVLTQEDAERVVAKYKQIKEAINGVMAGIVNSNPENIMSAFTDQWSLVEQLRKSLQQAEAMLATLMRQEREKRGWSSADLATKLGCSVNDINEMERGGPISPANAGMMRRLFQ